MNAGKYSSTLLIGTLLSTYLLAVPILQPLDVTKRELNVTVAAMDVMVYPVDGDLDGDGVANSSDAFPVDPDEWLDSDGDGIGNNADTDDDGDGIDDKNEIHYGFDLLDPSDAAGDADGDGISNLAEINAGTNPLGTIEISTLWQERGTSSWDEVSHIDKSGMHATRSAEQHIVCHTGSGTSKSSIRIQVPGSTAMLHLDGTLEVSLPFHKKINFKLKANGKIETFVEDADTPTDLLPAGTEITVTPTETEITIPLSGTLKF